MQRFTDAFSKTIPMWAAVVNRAVAAVRREKAFRLPGTIVPLLAAANGPAAAEDLAGGGMEGPESEARCAAGIASEASASAQEASGSDPEWDVGLHLPLWVSANEALQIESRLDGWVEELLSCVGKDQIWALAQVIISRRLMDHSHKLAIRLASPPPSEVKRYILSRPLMGCSLTASLLGCIQVLTKPLRPLWISQSSLIWIDQVGHWPTALIWKTRDSLIPMHCAPVLGGLGNY